MSPMKVWLCGIPNFVRLFLLLNNTAFVSVLRTSSADWLYFYCFGLLARWEMLTIVPSVGIGLQHSAPVQSTDVESLLHWELIAKIEIKTTKITVVFRILINWSKCVDTRVFLNEVVLVYRNVTSGGLYHGHRTNVHHSSWQWINEIAWWRREYFKQEQDPTRSNITNEERRALDQLSNDEHCCATGRQRSMHCDAL